MDINSDSACFYLRNNRICYDIMLGPKHLRKHYQITAAPEEWYSERTDLPVLPSPRQLLSGPSQSLQVCGGSTGAAQGEGCENPDLHR